MGINNIVWLRNDFRILDNPALLNATTSGKTILIYILDSNESTVETLGSASRCYLHALITQFQKDTGAKLNCYEGDPIKILPEIIEHFKADAIYWNRAYSPYAIQRDRSLKESLKIKVHSYNGSLLWEPWHVLKSDNTPYRVFTPFYRKGCIPCEREPRTPLPKANLDAILPGESHLGVENLNLLEHKPWENTLISHWEIGEQGAMQRLTRFCEHGLNGYKDGRNFPNKKNVSMLSADLRWGTLSPNQVYDMIHNNSDVDTRDKDHFLSELGWREFSYYLLYHFPKLLTENLQPKFDRFPWSTNPQFLKAWQQGQTGYPIVDAGMRQMYATGYMHNRVRMIVGSFLVKNLLLDWREGAAWFWDCLVDADIANNFASWQWVAGCGADAAPYFRIFNPITQGDKFDKHGEYTKYWVPELKDLPENYLFQPWEAPSEVLKAAGISLGNNYPHPIVDLKTSRQKALDAFAQLKS